MPAKKNTPKSAGKSAAPPPPKSAATTPDSAEEALALLMPRLLEIEASAVSQPRNDVRAAASFVLSEIVPRVNEVGLNRRLQSFLPAAEFDFSAVADLKPAAQACLASQAQLASSTAQTATVRLPIELLDEATRVKQRMLKVCTYHFGEDTQLGAEVSAIRLGTGYLDLAQDLLRLGALYKQNAATLALDGRYYDGQDGARASALSARITSELRQAPSANSARDLAWRAYAFLAERYEEVASACRFLERKTDGEQRFPSLRVATSQGRKRPQTKDDAAPGPEPEPKKQKANG